MWVRNAWYVAAWLDDVTNHALLPRTIINEPLVYRTADGAAVALEDRCCGRLAPLSKGQLEHDDLRSMYHGMKFAPDGRCIETAFHEDKAIIEAQQTVIELDPEQRMMSLSFDAGPNLFRAILRQLIEA